MPAKRKKKRRENSRRKRARIPPPPSLDAPLKFITQRALRCAIASVHCLPIDLCHLIADFVRYSSHDTTYLFAIGGYGNLTLDRQIHCWTMNQDDSSISFAVKSPLLYPCWSHALLVDTSDGTSPKIIVVGGLAQSCLKSRIQSFDVISNQCTDITSSHPILKDLLTAFPNPYRVWVGNHSSTSRRPRVWMFETPTSRMYDFVKKVLISIDSPAITSDRPFQIFCGRGTMGIHVPLTHSIYVLTGRKQTRPEFVATTLWRLDLGTNQWTLTSNNEVEMAGYIWISLLEDRFLVLANFQPFSLFILDVTSPHPIWKPLPSALNVSLEYPRGMTVWNDHIVVLDDQSNAHILRHDDDIPTLDIPVRDRGLVPNVPTLSVFVTV